MKALALVFLLAVLPAWAQEPPAPAEEAGPSDLPVVTAIELRSEVRLEDPDELLRLLAFEVGEPLTEEAVRGSLRNLQATGLTSSAEIYTRADDSGRQVEVIVVLRPVVRVREVRLEGELGLDRNELRRVLPQNEAEPLAEERVLQGRFALEDLYAERGYFTPVIGVGVDVDEQSRQATVVYHVRSGPRSRVEEIRFEGDLGPFKPAQLVAELEVKPGEAFSRAGARDGADRLERWLIEQGHRSARVGAPAEEPAPERRAVRLVYPISAGPKVDVQVIGADLDRLRRRGLLPFLGREGYDEALVLQAAERIKNDYQREGHYKVQVEWEEQEPSEDLLRVILRIEPGPQYTLQEVAFAGNETFGSDDLEELVTTSGRTLLARSSGRLVDDVLEEDIKNVHRFYQLQGFSKAEVGPAQVEERGEDLFVTIPIEEGPRLRVVNLEMQGIESLSGDEVRNALQLTAGGPFHPLLLERSLNNLRTTYQDKGFSVAQVSARQDWNPEHTLVDVTVEVLEGPQILLDRVIVRGNRRTESEVIRRTIAVDRGDPISERRALEVERDLYRLGVFSSVDAEVTRTGLESATRDLIVRVEEGRPRRLSYGLGLEYGTDKSRTDELAPRGTFSFSHNNVAGRAYTLRTDLLVVGDRDRIFRIRFDQPYSLRWAVPVSYSLFYFHEEKEDWDVDRRGARIEAEKLFADRRVGLALDYRIVETGIDSDFPPGLRGVEREDRPYDLTSLIPSFHWDRRNDPILATRGWSSLAQLQYAFPAFGTDGDFLKLFLQQTQYLDLRNFGTVAASLRAGAIEPFSRLGDLDPEVEGLLNADVFIDERFFAGGGSTHRAYGRDDLGLRGETLILRPGRTGTEEDDFAAVGGTGLLLFNLEYRFPIFETLGGTVFYDLGNVWADWRNLDTGGLKGGAGVGLRYLSPIGPLRLDVGWKLDREPGEREYAVSVSFGNPF